MSELPHPQPVYTVMYLLWRLCGGKDGRDGFDQAIRERLNRCGKGCEYTEANTIQVAWPSGARVPPLDAGPGGGER